jgi:hypothetical protein
MIKNIAFLLEEILEEGKAWFMRQDLDDYCFWCEGTGEGPTSDSICHRCSGFRKEDEREWDEERDR